MYEFAASVLSPFCDAQYYFSPEYAMHMVQETAGRMASVKNCGIPVLLKEGVGLSGGNKADYEDHDQKRTDKDRNGTGCSCRCRSGGFHYFRNSFIMYPVAPSYSTFTQPL